MCAASTVMTSPAQAVSNVESVTNIETLLLQCTQHNAFPVIDEPTNIHKGMVRRDQLIAVIKCHIFTTNNSTNQTVAVEEAMDDNNKNNKDDDLPDAKESVSPWLLLCLVWIVNDNIAMPLILLLYLHQLQRLWMIN